jgi:hypothetical protein
MCLLKVRHCVVAPLCMLGLLFCAAQESAQSSEVSYLSFQVPFVRDPYGTITSFDPPRGTQTTATSINASV